MSLSPVRAALAAAAFLFAAWALRPAAKYLLQPETTLLVEQLRGDGCQFQDHGRHTLNPAAGFLVRHPEFACPMWAAARLAERTDFAPAGRDAVIAALESAIGRRPDTFDTGDGILRYGDAMRAALGRLRDASRP